MDAITKIKPTTNLHVNYNYNYYMNEFASKSRQIIPREINENILYPHTICSVRRIRAI